MSDPVRYSWLSFSEALEEYLEAREKLNSQAVWEREAAEIAMKGCAAQMDYLAPKKDELWCG